MLLSLVFPALALTVPMRATFKEEIWPGEAAIVSSTTTAAVAAYSTTNGTRFSVSADELTANKREASGKGGLSFTESPANAVQSWAVYYIDADGEVLGDPEIVQVSFDGSGNGAVAAGTGSRLASLGISSQKDGGKGQWFAATAKVSVQDTGANAAYIGLVQLAEGSTSSALVSDPDMDAMDATTFATFQAEGLDAILPLDNYTIQLDGTLTVDGLSVSADGVVQAGADIEWHVGFFTGEVACQKGGSCTPVVSETLHWFEPIGNVKKKSQVAPRVSLKNTDVVFETYDAGLELTIEGDVRNLEVSAALDVYDHDVIVAGSDVVSLDPDGFGVQAKSDDDDTGMIVDIFIDGDCDDCGDYDNQGAVPTWTWFANDTYSVTLLDSEGKVVSEHACTLDATARTVAGTGKKETLVGSCTQDPSGTEVRRLQLSIGTHGYLNWTVDLASPAFVEPASAPTCEKGGACTGGGATALGGTVEISRDGLPIFTRKLQVNETEFGLPFVLTDVSEGLRGSVAIDLYAPTAVTWTVSDGVATAMDSTGVVATFNLEDVGLDPTGGMVCKSWGAEDATAPKAGSTEPLSLSKASKDTTCTMDKVELSLDVEAK